MADKTEQVPSRKEIAKLRRWARVAFAARCARRVQPLFKILWPEAPAKYREAVEKAIRIAESSAGAGAPPLGAARAAARAADAAARAADAGTRAADAAADAANTAADAYVADAARAADHAERAADHAADAFADDADAAVRAVRAMRADLEKLKAAAKKGRWTYKTPVPPEFFGPLWPEGEPPRWPSTAAEPARQKKAQTASKAERLVVQASVHAPVADETLVNGITELYQALNRYHILCGGTGLTIDDWQIFVRSGTRERVLV